MNRKPSSADLAVRGFMDAVAGLDATRPHLRRMALSGHPGALNALRDQRAARLLIVAANRAIEFSPKQAA